MSIPSDIYAVLPLARTAVTHKRRIGPVGRDGVALKFSPPLFGVNQRYVNHQLWRRCLSRAKYRHAGYSSSSTTTQTAYTVQSGNP
jgi:hypothetical protein